MKQLGLSRHLRRKEEEEEEDADLDAEADAANAVEAVPDDDTAAYTGAAATGWDSDAAEGVPIAALPPNLP